MAILLFPALPAPAPNGMPGGWPAPTRIGSVAELLPQQAAASVLNATATPAADRQMTVAALYAMLPIVYGAPRCGALLANALVYQGKWVFWLLWGNGSFDAITGLTMDNRPLPVGTIAKHYAVSSVPSGQTIGALGSVDATLSAAFASLGGYPAFTETCPGVCYSVVTVPADQLSGPPTFNAQVQGLRIYDSRQDSTNGGSGAQRLATPSTWTFTRNPALILAHFLTTYDSRTMDWSSVAATANACDALVGAGSSQEVRRLCDITLDTEQSTQQWVDALRTAAACWVVQNGDVTKLVPDVAGSSVATYSDAAGNILEISNPVQQGATKLPTVVEIVYTDTSNLPHRDLPAMLAKRPGVDAGTTDYRLSTVRMPWITRATQANREAIERLNKLWLRSVQMDLALMDEGLKHEPGDLISITYPELALTALQVRVVAVTPNADGWTLGVTKEDPGVYATTVQTGPTIPSTNSPLPNDPPSISGLSVVEDVYQVQTGRFASRLIIAWTAATWPHVDSYVVTITQAGVVKDTAVLPRGSAPTYTSIQLTENLTYVVTVGIVSTSGTAGPLATGSITNAGKLAKPSDVPSITGFEVGGEVRLSWVPAVDLDLTAHEIRYSTTGGTWASATLLDRVAAPSVRYATKSVPAGSWRFWIKGLDSVRSSTYPNGQESVNAAYIDIVVTSDSNAFIAASQPFSSPSLFSMSVVPAGWLTDFGQTWNALFPSALSTYANPLATYHTAGTSGLVTTTVDLGLSLSGGWIIDPVYTNLSGAATVKIEISANGGEAAKTITAATNATPIVITSAGHGYANNEEVVIAGVGGNTAANGTRRVTVIDANTFSLQNLFGVNIAGNGTYTSGGTASRWVWQTFIALLVHASARFVRMRIETTGTVLVTKLGSVRINVVTRREGGNVTTSASAPTVITFSNKYNKAVSAGVTPQGTSPIVTAYDLIEVSGSRGIGVGQSLYFDGAAAHVEVADSVPLRLATALTVEAQAYVTAPTANYQTIVRKDTETGTVYAWALRINPPGQLEAYYNNGTTVFYIRSTSSAPIGRWIHTALAISGTTLSVYMDGLLQETTTITGTQGVPTGRMGIGATPPSIPSAGAWMEWFGGRIDDVRVWNVARTQAQIQANMNVPLVGNESGLVGYWKFDSLSGTSATDSTSNANHGTVSGAKWRPLDGMDVYAFNSVTGAQVAAPVSWDFSGV